MAAPRPEIERKHFVYLFRDRSGTPLYIGYGQSQKRAFSHISRTHNVELEKRLQRGDFTLEIAGPFGSAETALAVETALISALRTKCNVSEGHKEWRFRPPIVTARFSERPMMPELNLSELKEVLGAKKHFPIVFVRINERYFEEDDRPGFNPDEPPKDGDILRRIDRWWQLACRLAERESIPERSPGILAGIYGPPGNQMIIGSVFVDRSSWSEAEVESNGLLHLPTNGPSDLDALQLRGRRISPKLELRFGQFRNQQFILLHSDGRKEGGRS